MRKAEALNIIRYEVALNGKVTSKAMRLYTENRISKTLFDAFVQQGIRYYNIRNEKTN